MKKSFFKWLVFLAPAGVGVLLFGYALMGENAVAGADPTDAQAVALGQRVYAENCAACHGENLQGEPDWRSRDAEGYLPAPPHDPTGHTWHHDDQLLFQITKQGTQAIAGGDYKTRMDGFGDRLSDAEIWAVLAYIKSTWPAEVLARQEERNR
ncbi:MAG: c-type cytochrome [Magnetospiraceae bacterium]